MQAEPKIYLVVTCADLNSQERASLLIIDQLGECSKRRGETERLGH